jgi:hypothetical protein
MGAKNTGRKSWVYKLIIYKFIYSYTVYIFEYIFEYITASYIFKTDTRQIIISSIALIHKKYWIQYLYIGNWFYLFVNFNFANNPILYCESISCIPLWCIFNRKYSCSNTTGNAMFKFKLWVLCIGRYTQTQHKIIIKHLKKLRPFYKKISLFSYSRSSP